MAGSLQDRAVRIHVNLDQASLSAANSQLAQLGQGGAVSQLQGMNSQLAALGSNAASAGRSVSAANDNIESMATATGHASGGILSMIGHLGTMTLALAGLGFVTAGIHELAEAFIESANEATEVAARLSLVTNGTAEFAAAQANVAAIAGATRSNLVDTAELYQKIGIQASHLGASQSDVTAMTKTFAETLKVSGASTQQAQAGMRQLGEAFDQNTLSGIHFKAMQTDNIRFMQLLAASMGVTQGKLKEMGTAGEITGAQMKKALTDPTLTAGLQKQFDRMPVGFADVRMAIKNTLVQLAGDFMEGSGLNNSLRSLYDKVAQFATDAKPAFEKIGVAAKAAFATFGPVISEALGLIRPFFAFLLDNAPTLIQLAKVGAEAWLAYRASIAAVAAVDMAKGFITSAQSLAMLIDLSRGGSGAVGLLKGAFLIASEGVDTFTASLLANPFTFIAAAITATVALLYEFRDSISISADGVTSLGDLFRAAWESIGPAVTGAINIVKSVFGGAWDWLKGLFTDIGSALYDAFSLPLNSIKSTWDAAFGDLPLSFEGIMVGAARTGDGLIGIFRGTTAAIGVLFTELPSTLYASFSPQFQAILSGAKTMAVGLGEGIASVYNAIVGWGSSVASTISSVFNSVATFLDTWINKAISGLNTLISLANKTGAGIATIAAVKIGPVEPPKVAPAPFANLGKDMAKAFNGAFGHELEDGTKGLLARAHAIGAARNAKTGPVTPGGGTTPHADDGDSDDKKKKRDKRAEQEKEFWQTLQNELIDARFFGLELQKHTEEQKLQKILGRDLLDNEKMRVDTIVEQIANAKALTELDKSAFDIHNKNVIAQERATNLTEDQAKIQDVLDAKMVSALDAGVTLATINSADYQTRLAKLKTELQIEQSYANQTKHLKDAQDFAKKYNGKTDSDFQISEIQKGEANFAQEFAAGKLVDSFGAPMTEATFEAINKGAQRAIDKLKLQPLELLANVSITAKSILDQTKAGQNRDDALDALSRSGLSPEKAEQVSNEIAQNYRDEMWKANREVADKFVDDLTAGIDQLADIFGGKIGGVLKNFSTMFQSMEQNADGASGVAKLTTLISGEMGSSFRATASAMELNAGNLKTGFSNLTKPLQGLKDSFDPAQGGSALKGIGSAVGGALQGEQMGAGIGSLMGSLGLKGGENGAKIGGTIGGLTGNPVIAAAASVIGGLIGSLFYKAPKGQATITGTNSVALSGTSAELQSQASGMAGGVTSGLTDLASKLGATVGQFAVSIGTYKDMIRVNPTGGAVGGVTGSGAITYASQDDAVKAAIQFAVKQGALQGLSDLANKAVKALDVDSAVTFVQQWNDVLKDFNAMTDPVTAAVHDIIDPLKTLRDTMVQVGASTTDLTKVDQYRAAKLDAAIKQQLSTLTDFEKTLNGDGSGVSDYDRLTKDLSDFDAYKAKIAAGDSSIDQSAFTSLAGEILSLAGNVDGTSTGQFQAIRDMLAATNASLMSNITNTFNAAAGTTDGSTANDATTAAINSQTQAIVSEQTLQTSVLKQIAANTTPVDSSVQQSGGSLSSVNGKYMGATY